MATPCDFAVKLKAMCLFLYFDYIKDISTRWTADTISIYNAKLIHTMIELVGLAYSFVQGKFDSHHNISY